MKPDPAFGTPAPFVKTHVDCRADSGLWSSYANGGGSDSTGRTTSFTARTLIYHQGDLVDCIYQITSGAVMLSKLLPDGRRQIVELLGPGDVFGCSLVPVQGCSAETLSKTTCVAFDRLRIERSPALTREHNARLYAQLCTLQEHVPLLGSKTGTERMADCLRR